MRRFTASIGVGALVLGGLTLGLAPAASAGEEHPPDSNGPIVVVTGLDNPRQLSFAPHDTLLIAEAGSGGDTCVTPPPVPGAPPEASGPQCGGLSGGISAVHDPDDLVNTPAHRVVDGLFSVAGPDGSFAGGSSGVAATDIPDEYIVPENGSLAGVPPELAALSGSDQVGHLLVVQTGGPQQFVLPYADVAAAEADQNPDGAQIDSNPYGVLFVDPTPQGEPGTDGYALVADAAANTVWKVTPDFSAVPAHCTGDACIPPYAITVFATYPTPPDDDITPEFVPTSLATDAAGTVYVGGLGSEVPGAAEIRQYSAAGKELNSWGGFTGITGLAVDPEGAHLYVSQLFGSVPSPTPTAPPGNVVRVDIAQGTYQSVDVPFPAGVALDWRGRVYVSAFSVSPAKGTETTVMGPGMPGGQVWRISFDDQPAIGLPVIFPLDTGGTWQTAVPIPTQLSQQCGGQTVGFVPGDHPGEWRVTRNAQGDRIEFRGTTTVDLVGQHGQVLIDELDVSGPGYQFSRPDGSFEFSFDGPNFNYTSSPQEEELYTSLGLPLLQYWTSGTFTEKVAPDGSVELPSVPKHVVDLCSLIPAA